MIHHENIIIMFITGGEKSSLNQDSNPGLKPRTRTQDSNPGLELRASNPTQDSNPTSQDKYPYIQIHTDYMLYNELKHPNDETTFICPP